MISVIVPIYNVENYLDKCIRSILCQTYSNLQIILVNDGSTDSSGQICDQFACIDSRIEVIHQVNEGLVAARKAGICKAKGDYIGFVDGDDYIDERMFERLYDLLVENKADVVHSGYIKNNSKIYGYQGALAGSVSDILSEYIFNVRTKDIITPSIWSKLFTAESIKKSYTIVPNSQSYGEDLVCLVKVLCAGYKMYCTHEAYYHYVQREESIMNKKSIEKYQSILKLYDCLYNMIVYDYCLSNLQNNLFDFMQECIWNELSKKYLCIDDYIKYRIPFKPRKEKIILFGAGKVGRDYYAQIVKYQEATIVAWVDKNYENIRCDYYKLESIDTIKSIDFDRIIIAVSNIGMVKEIEHELISMGIPHAKIFWKMPT